MRPYALHYRQKRLSLQTAIRFSRQCNSSQQAMLLTSTGDIIRFSRRCSPSQQATSAATEKAVRRCGSWELRSLPLHNRECVGQTKTSRPLRHAQRAANYLAVSAVYWAAITSSTCTTSWMVTTPSLLTSAAGLSVSDAIASNTDTAS